jgi:hypothetical protein
MKRGKGKMKCITGTGASCQDPVAWVRHTQFAGSHPFCEVHAKAESDFGVNDSYKDWEKIPDLEVLASAKPEEV